MIPAFNDAKIDKTLRGDISLVVYLHLLDELDPIEFKEVKRVVLATRLEVSENAIRRALQKLVKQGYLRRGRAKPGEPRTYRLVYKRMPMSDETRTAPEPTRYTRPELPTCETTGKVMFRSPEAAERASREMRRRKDDRTHPYRCHHCRRWHLGHAETDKKSR